MYYYVEVLKGETIATIKRRVHTHFRDKETRDEVFENVKENYENLESFKSDENSFSFKRDGIFELHRKFDTEKEHER